MNCFNCIVCLYYVQNWNLSAPPPSLCCFNTILYKIWEKIYFTICVKFSPYLLSRLQKICTDTQEICKSCVLRFLLSTLPVEAQTQVVINCVCILPDHTAEKAFWTKNDMLKAVLIRDRLIWVQPIPIYVPDISADTDIFG